MGSHAVAQVGHPWGCPGSRVFLELKRAMSVRVFIPPLPIRKGAECYRLWDGPPGGARFHTTALRWWDHISHLGAYQDWILITDVLKGKAKGSVTKLRSSETEPFPEPPDFKGKGGEEHHVLKIKAFPILTGVVETHGWGAEEPWELAAVMLLWIPPPQLLESGWGRGSKSNTTV